MKRSSSGIRSSSLFYTSFYVFLMRRCLHTPASRLQRIKTKHTIHEPRFYAAHSQAPICIRPFVSGCKSCGGPQPRNIRSTLVRTLRARIVHYPGTLHLLCAPANIGVPISPVSPVYQQYIHFVVVSYLMFAGGSMLGTYSNAMYPMPTNATIEPAAYFHQLSPMVMHPTNR